MQIQFLSTNISTPRGVILKRAGRQSVLLQQGVPHPSRRCEYMSWARTGLDPINKTASAHASEAMRCTTAPVLSAPEKGVRTRFWERPSLPQRAAPHNDGPNSHPLAMAGGIKRGNDGGRLRRQPPPPPRSGPIVARSDPSAGRLPQARAIGLAQVRQRLVIARQAASASSPPRFSYGRFKHPYRGLRGEAHSGVPREAPQVFVPALAAWPAPQPRPAPPAMLPVAPRPTLN